MNDTPSSPDDDEDLLKTIRMMVQEEAEREAPVRPGFFPAPDAPPEAAETPQPQPMPPAASGPLVLGAMARVGAPTMPEPPEQQPLQPPSGGAAPIYDEEALRRIVSELVRDEFDQIMGEALDHRIRQLARRELVTLLARARGEDA